MGERIVSRRSIEYGFPLKLSGDVPKEHIELADQLEQMERLIETDPYSDERKAQIYVYLAHNWYKMGCEEEGNRLLVKADRVFPGYFKETVIKHQLEDETFDYIVKSITVELIRLLL